MKKPFAGLLVMPIIANATTAPARAHIERVTPQVLCSRFSIQVFKTLNKKNGKVEADFYC